jgi:hypothetical protein
MTLLPDQLKSDVDFTYTKLQNYILNFIYNSKEDLEFKFDSLKTTITQPITPSCFLN